MCILRTLVFCILLGGTAFGQETPHEPEKLASEGDQFGVPDAIAKVKSGHFVAVHVDRIARAGAVEAIPALKEQFVRVQDPFMKAKIASGLLRMGEKDNVYWDCLLRYANPALESDAPDFMSYDSKGKSVPGPSPDFLTWAKAHNLSPPQSAGDPSPGEDSLYLFPARLVLLGESRDPRAIPLLRRALSSPNHMIEIAAAWGLGDIGDKESIPFIVEACGRAPAEAAAVIARALVFFDDNTAQSAVDQYIPKDLAKMYRDERAQGKTSPLN